MGIWSWQSAWLVEANLEADSLSTQLLLVSQIIKTWKLMFCRSILWYLSFSNSLWKTITCASLWHSHDKSCWPGRYVSWFIIETSKMIVLSILAWEIVRIFFINIWLERIHFQRGLNHTQYLGAVFFIIPGHTWHIFFVCVKHLIC